MGQLCRNRGGAAHTRSTRQLKASCQNGFQQSWAPAPLGAPGLIAAPTQQMYGGRCQQSDYTMYVYVHFVWQAKHCLRSLVVERQTCNLKVLGSILSEGFASGARAVASSRSFVPSLPYGFSNRLRAFSFKPPWAGWCRRSPGGAPGGDSRKFSRGELA